MRHAFAIAALLAPPLASACEDAATRCYEDADRHSRGARAFARRALARARTASLRAAAAGTAALLSHDESSEERKRLLRARAQLEIATCICGVSAFATMERMQAKIEAVERR